MNLLRPLFTLALLSAALISNAQLAQTKGQQAREPKQSATQAPQLHAKTNAKFTYVITDAANGTFGYDIHNDGKLFMRQQNIPGQPGNKGCATKQDAEKLVQLVIQKIQKGEMPPTVTTIELQSLNIIR